MMNLLIDARAEPHRIGGPLSGAISRDDALRFAAVADSPAGGSLALAASQLALDVIRAHIALHRDELDRYARSPSEALRDRIIEAMTDAFSRAAKEIFALGRRRSSTVEVSVDAAVIAGDESFVGHAGDGAIFLVRRGLLHRLTSEAPLDEGDEEILLLPASAALGGRPGAMPTFEPELPAPGPLGRDAAGRPEVLVVELQDGDRLLLAGGALSAALPDEALRPEIGDRTLDSLMDHLVSRARGRGGGRALMLAGLHLGVQRPPARLSPEAEAKARLAVLARMPLFAGCKPAELEGAAGVTRPRTYRRGALLLTQGQQGEGIYLIVAGDVDILKDGTRIAHAGPGSNFGEMSMLDEPTASASVRALSDVEVLVISRDAFFRLLKANPTFAVKVLWNMLLRLSSNLRRTSARLAEVTEEIPG